MLVWRRLHVFVQLLNVLCVIGDVVPAGESSPWRGPTAARIVNGVTSSARDATNGVSSTSRDDITGNFLRNFDDRSMTYAKKPPEVGRTIEALEVPSMETQPEVAKTSEALEVPSMEMQPEVPKSSEALEVPSMKTQPEVPKSSEALEVPSMKTQPEVTRASEGLEVPSMKTQPEVMRASEGLEVPSMKTQPEVGRISEGAEVPSMQTQPEVPKSSEALEVPSMKTQPEVGRISEGAEVPSMKTQPEVGRISEGAEVPSIKMEPEVATTSEAFEIPSMKMDPEVATTSEAFEETLVTMQPEVMRTFEDLEVNLVTVQPEVPRTSEALEVTSIMIQPEVAKTRGDKLEGRRPLREPKKVTEDSKLAVPISLNLLESDFSNVVESTDQPTDSDISLPECKIVEPPSLDTSSTIGDLEPVTSSGQQALEGEINVESLSFAYLKPNSLAITWKKPNGNVEVKDYIIQWSMKTEAVHSCRLSNEIFFYAITGLKACTTYTVEVLPRLETANGSKRVITGTTGLDVAKDLTDFKIAQNSTDWLEVSWSMPSTDCVKDYLISVCDGNNCTEDRINTTTHNKTDLSPCRTYNFNLTVFAQSNAEAYGGTNINGTTNFLKPGAPTPAETESGNYILKVSWPEPIGHTCVDHYRVTWNHDGKSGTKKTTATMIEFKEMESCATYDIIITPVDINLVEGPQEIIKSKMTLPAVTDPPVRLHGPSVTAKSITINWLIRTNETNNCDAMLMIVECNWTKLLGEGYYPNNGVVEYHIHSNTNNEAFDTVVEKLSPFTKYDCKSYTINYGGRSRESEIVSAQTLEA